MKKIIAVFDGLKFSESTLKYSIELAQQQPVHLVGVFLNDFTYHSYKVYDVIVKDGVSSRKLNQLSEQDELKRKSAREKFEKACQAAKLQYSVHTDTNVAYQALIHETIYADLCVIDFNESFSHHKENLPTSFIKNLLIHTQCPVLLVPKKYVPLEKILLLYDGNPTAVYAIKQFSYVLGNLTSLPVEVLTIKESYTNVNLHLPDKKLMKEFMKRHFPDAVYTVKKGDFAEDEIVNYLKRSRENSLTVLGAYRRGTISRWFKESMADRLMKNIKSPLFIAHNK